MNAYRFRHLFAGLLACALLIACLPLRAGDYQDGLGLFYDTPPNKAFNFSAEYDGLPLPFPLNPLHTGTWWLPERPGVYASVQLRPDTGTIFGQSLNLYLMFDRLDYTQQTATWAAGSSSQAVQDVRVTLRQPVSTYGYPPLGYATRTIGTATVRGICSPARLDITLSIPPRLPIIYRFRPQILAYGDPCEADTKR